jgi:hypothetical protein
MQSEYFGTSIESFQMKKVLLSVLVLGTSLASQAAAIDVTSTVTEIAAQAAPIALIGGGVLAIMVAVKAFKWVRAALS